MKKTTSRTSAFTLVEIMIVVAIIGLLAAIAIPNFVRARTTAQKNACINNLRQLDGAVQQYALENKKASTDTYTMDNLKDYVKLTSDLKIPQCPSGGDYTAGGSVIVTPLCPNVATLTEHKLP